MRSWSISIWGRWSAHLPSNVCCRFTCVTHTVRWAHAVVWIIWFIFNQRSFFLSMFCFAHFVPHLLVTHWHTHHFIQRHKLWLLPLIAALLISLTGLQAAVWRGERDQESQCGAGVFSERCPAWNLLKEFHVSQTLAKSAPASCESYWI